jgi:mannose-1-phosphate guanylyltransferase / mannose-6-phosphate isomerase
MESRKPQSFPVEALGCLVLNQKRGENAMTRGINVIPLILAGGAGTRLWPLSRGQSPKQFLRLGERQTLLHQTLQRCSGDVFHKRPIVVGADDNRGQLLCAVQDLDMAADIVLEPMRRNSCAAIVAGALLAFQRDPAAVVLMVAADHHIPDETAFRSAVAEALPAAEQGQLVSFGIIPRHPATGYGYILPSPQTTNSAVKRVERFVEKPDIETAARYVVSGFLWNSGNILFKAKALLDEVVRNAPDVLLAVSQALEFAARDVDFTRLSKDHFARSPNISIDYAVMEKTRNASVLPVDYVWSDIGTWDAVSQTLPTDGAGNSVVGRGLSIASSGVMIHSESLLTTVVGCNDIVVVTTKDAVLVVKKSDTEDVKTLVDQLRSAGYVEADAPLREVE